MKWKMLSLIIICSLSLCSCSSKAQANNYTAPEAPKSTNTAKSKEVVKTVSPSSEKVTSTAAVNPAPSKISTSVNTDTNLSTKERDWFFQPKTDGTPSGEPADVLNIISKHSAYYLGDTSKKIIYLTFDEGYENGYTSKILDILKEKNVKAAFFVTTPYIKADKDLVKRMVDEGHLVCNHTTTHPSMAATALKGKTSFENEITTCADTFKEVTGQEMPKFFRPPMGKYSELSLKYTEDMGYKSIFWSFAYNDWDVNKQPTEDYAKRYITARTHPGGIYLLHAVSKTNTSILPWLIDNWKSQGYEFRSLTELK